EFKAGNLSQEAQAALTVFQSTVPILPAPAAFFHDGDFKEICERLPVIARNQLESGISRNLFYEEVVPRQTRFVFFVERPKDHDGLHEYLKKLDFRIQLGANASIGYGVCKIERVFPSSPPKSN
ncbi:MAG: hypothetical protein KDD43_06715, partial [Bdellovibrionales bacterium]|nr:hypothetical protein [Bdellovibrionales bacterium]